jgi:predicted permease
MDDSTNHWPAGVEIRVDTELAYHLEMLAQRFEAQGMAPDAAREAARTRFGDLGGINDECHRLARRIEASTRRREMLNDIVQDGAYALRTLRRAPLFSVVAVGTLALGIGAGTAIFSVVDAVLLRSLPYAHAGRVVSVRVARNAVSAPEFADMRTRLRAFDAVAALRPQASPITGECGAGAATCEPQPATGVVTSPNLFELLGAKPAFGRSFVEADGGEAAPPVVLLSDALWKQRFGGDSGVLGRSINVAGRVRTVIGVMPAGVRFPDAQVDWMNERADLWIPFSWERRSADARGNQILAVVARLAPAADVAAARRDLAAMANQFRQDYPVYYSTFKQPWTPDAVPVRDAMVGEAKNPLLLLAGAVLAVLVIACLNVANLLLARGAARSRELAVRRALGAGRGRIVRQLLTESLILSVTGGAIGIAIAMGATRALLALSPGTVPLADGVGLDGTVLAFALALSIVTGVAFGLAPALRFAQAGPGGSLVEGGRGAGIAQPRRRVRNLIVVAEVALAVTLLVSAGLLVRSFAALRSVPTGITAGNSLTLWLTPSRARYDSAAKLVRLYEAVQQRLGALPGVQVASAVRPLPMSGEGWSGSYDIEGRAVPAGGEPPHAEYSVAMPGYFRAMGIAFVEGRDFGAADRADAPGVLIVDDALAKRDWPGESAIGKRLNANGPSGTWQTVVGVVRHVRRAGARTPGEPQIYIPVTQHAENSLAFVVRTALEPAPLAAAVRREVRAIDPELPIAKLQPMRSVETATLARERFTTALIAVLAGSALLLAATGLYGVLAYLVAQRTNEIGIRLALGASRGSIVRLILGEGLVTTLAGLGLGLLGAVGLSGAIAHQLYDVRPTDPLTYGVIGGLLAIVAVVASIVPARRAMRVDPVAAFRA